MSNLPQHICPLPWISIETTSMGNFRPCCLAQDLIPDGVGIPLEARTTDASTAYNSVYMQSMRETFRAGGKPKACSRCWDEEDAGRTSKRMHSVNKFKDVMDKIQWDSNTPEQLWFLDLKLGNICNLRCRICGTWSSSRWAQEEIGYETSPNKKQTPSYQILKAGEWPENNPGFWGDLEQVLPNVQYIEFTGGEPFMVIRHYDMLKKAVDLGAASHISLHYNTNGTMYPELEEIWSHFREVEIAFSIDNTGAKFEYERTGAVWDRVEDNIRRFKELASRNANIKLQSCTTVNIQNVYDLPDTIQWLDQQGFGFVYINMLHDPRHMNIVNMTKAAKDLVRTKLQSTPVPEKYQSEIDAVIRFMDQGDSTDGSAFRAYMDKIDQRRDESFSKLYPELAKAMGYAT